MKTIKESYICLNQIVTNMCKELLYISVTRSSLYQTAMMRIGSIQNHQSVFN